MASTGKITGVSSKYNAYANLTWEIYSTSAEKNTTSVYWHLEIRPAGGSFALNAPMDCTVVIEGNTYTGTIYKGNYSGAYGIMDGYTTIQHNLDGSKTFSLSFSITGDSSSIGNIDASGTAELDAIHAGAKIISAPNFTDEQEPWIAYSNPAGEAATSLQACISYDGYDTTDVPYRDIPKNFNSYYFELTEEEWAALRARVTTGTSVTVKFYIKTVVREQTYLNSVTRAFTIVNPEPLLEPAVLDINENTKELTGDNKTIIKYRSIVSYNIGAEAVKGATIASQSMVNGSNVYTEPSGILEKVDSNKFDFTVTDSRGLITQKSLELTLIPYIPLTASLKINSFSASGDMSFTISGKYYAGSFGAQSNSMSLELELLDDSGEQVRAADLGAIEPTVDDLGNYTYSSSLEGLDHRKNYTLHIEVTDALTPAISLSTVAAPIPIFDWSKEDFNFNVPVSIQGAPIADFVTEIGQEAMGSNGIWYWRKWNSGRAECYGCRNYGNTGVSTAWGNLFRSDVFTQDLPLGLFKSAPESIQITLAQGSYGGWIVTHEESAPSQSASGSFIIVRPASANISQAYISFNVIGRWK